MVYMKLKFQDCDGDFIVLKTFDEFIEFMVGTFVTHDDIVDYITEKYGTVKIPKIGDVCVGPIIDSLFDDMQEGWCVFEDEYYEHIYEMICSEIDKNGYCDFTKEHVTFDPYSATMDSYDSHAKRYTYDVRFYYAN